MSFIKNISQIEAQVIIRETKQNPEHISVRKTPGPGSIHIERKLLDGTIIKEVHGHNQTSRFEVEEF